MAETHQAPRTIVDRIGDMRVESAAVALCAIIALLWIGHAAIDSLVNALTRAQFQFADNQWSEPPLMLQLWRMSTGGAAFLPTPLVNSYDYGPLYIWFLSAARHLLGLPFSVVTMRGLTIALGILALIPMAISSALISRRIDPASSGGAQLGLAAVTGAIIGGNVLFRCITFDVVHPDDMLDLLAVTSFALYYAIAMRVLHERWVWGLLLAVLIACFAKQTAFIIFPLLAIGLALARRIAPASFGAVIGAFAGLIGVAYVLLPGNVREWTLKVPGAHGYEFFKIDRLLNCWQHLTYYDAYLSILIVSSILVAIVLRRIEGKVAFAVDLPPLIAIAIMSFGAFFKVLGIYNNLTILGLVATPYVAAAIAVLILQSPAMRLGQWSQLVAGALTFALAFSMGDQPRQEPDKAIVGTMRGVNDAVHTTCAHATSVLVVVLPDLFFDCPGAKYALAASYEELGAAYPRYYTGPTVFDKPNSAEYVVIFKDLRFPTAWASGYRLVETLPSFTGYDRYYFESSVSIYRHV